MKALTLIVAMNPDGLIAVDGKIPWRIPEDLKRFKTLTTGHAMVMGRKTYESIGKPLPHRRSIAISRNPYERHAIPVAASTEGSGGASGSLEWWRSIDEALAAAAQTDDSPFVIGGAEIYELALPRATRLEVTIVAGEENMYRSEGAALTRFPLLSSDLFWDFRCIAITQATSVPDVEFLTFERRQS